MSPYTRNCGSVLLSYLEPGVTRFGSIIKTVQRYLSQLSTINYQLGDLSTTPTDRLYHHSRFVLIMDLYRATFVGSLLLNSLVLFRSYSTRTIEIPETENPEKIDHRGRVDTDRESIRKLKWRFFPIYLLVNGADWLQGPYIYPIYKGTFKFITSIGYKVFDLTSCR